MESKIQNLIDLVNSGQFVDLTLLANDILYDMQIGDKFDSYEVVKRTPNKITFNSGLIVSIRKLSNGVEYFHSASIIVRNKPYLKVDQLLRDLEGYLLYRIHSQHRY